MADVASLTPNPAASSGGVQPGTQTPGANAEAKEAAEQFEAIFLAQILQTMNAGIGGEEGGAAPGPLGGGDGPFDSMMTQEIAKLISRSGGIGVADAILQEMIKAQEVA